MKKRYLYLLQRTDKRGFKETIWTFGSCVGWKLIQKTEYKSTVNGLIGGNYHG